MQATSAHLMPTLHGDSLLPATSLILCSRNRPQLLADTVASILAGDDVPAEIVVVDQSDQPYAAMVTALTSRGCHIHYHWTRTRGLGRARNIGIYAAQHDILVFTDDDVLVTPSWFRALIGALLEAGPNGVVTGQVLAAEEEQPKTFAPSLKNDQAPAVYQGRVGKDVLWGNSMALYRSAIAAIGGFDERLGVGARFPSAEDNDFGFRLLEAGYRICYAPSAVLFHRAWRSEQDYPRLRWAYGRGQGAFYIKHLKLRDGYMLRRLIKSLYGHSINLACRARRERALAFGDAMYILGLLSGAGEWLLTQSTRPAPYGPLTGHSLTGSPSVRSNARAEV